MIKLINEETVIISAYPCCGKTYCYENNNGYSILDSDSSKFSWIERKRTKEELDEIKKLWDSEDHLLSGEGYINQIKNDIIKVRNPHFVEDYIDHIKENIGKVDFIFVSSHLEVRRALEAEGIKYITIYPDSSLLAEWVGRMYLRGNNASFIKHQIDHWDEYLRNIEKEPHGVKVIYLKSNEYIADNLVKIASIYKKEIERNERK